MSVISEIGLENAKLLNIDPPVWFIPAFVVDWETDANIAKFS